MLSSAIQARYELALERHQAGRLREADALYREVLAAEPDDVPCLQMLAVLAHQLGHNDIAARLLTRAVQLNPNDADLYNNLGVALAAMGRWPDAAAAYKRAISLRPDYAEAHNNLGTTLRDALQLDDAIAAYRQAILLRPDYAMAYSNLGLALQEKGETKEAIQCFRGALAIDRDLAEVYDPLAKALYEVGDLDQSILCAREAVKRYPHSAEALCALGSVLYAAARHDEALACHEKLLECKGDGRLAGGLLRTLYFNPACDATRILADHARWNELHARPLAPKSGSYGNNADPNRRLRVGYVSPDFCLQASSLFTLPLLLNHDHTAFEIFCYVSATSPDELTEIHRRHADTWRNTAGMSDEQVADLIRRDQIDVLVDLSLHSAGNRLLVFARKPVPVQVTWLAYPGTSGLETMDYRLSDPLLDPAESDEQWYSEKTIRLPDCFWCYHPLTNQPEVNPLPASRNGRLTFASLNNFAKVSGETLAMWGGVLAAVPDSRMIVHAPLGSSRDHVLESMDRKGVDPARIEFISRQSRMLYTQTYHRIDISLDTWPYNGGTTTFDSLWMGVPVVTLIGPTAVGRGGSSILSNLGMQEMVARTPEQFTQIASTLARDPARLAELRATLRSRMQNSPLMDAKRFARNVEAAYRAMWREWCQHLLPLARYSGRG